MGLAEAPGAALAPGDGDWAAPPPALSRSMPDWGGFGGFRGAAGWPGGCQPPFFNPA